MSITTSTDEAMLVQDDQLRVSFAQALDFSEVYNHLDSAMRAHHAQKQAIQNVIVKLKSGRMSITETIEALDRIINH